MYAHSLDTLERQELALRARVRATVLPEAPDPIGVAGAPEDRHKHNLTQLLHSNNNLQQDTPKMDPIAGGGMNFCFWDKYRSRHAEWHRTSLPATSGRSFSTPTSGSRKSEVDDLTGAATVGDSVGSDQEPLPQRHQALGTPESAGSSMSLGDDDCCY
jgi:hypothetical protein